VPPRLIQEQLKREPMEHCRQNREWLLSGMASSRSKTMQQQGPVSLSAALCADGWKAG
jgi:hypothetical protein